MQYVYTQLEKAYIFHLTSNPVTHGRHEHGQEEEDDDDDDDTRRRLNIVSSAIAIASLILITCILHINTTPNSKENEKLWKKEVEKSIIIKSSSFMSSSCSCRSLFFTCLTSASS